MRPYPSLPAGAASARRFTGRIVRSSSLNSGLTNDFPNPYPIYKPAEFIASKRISDVRFYGSYVLSKLDGNFPGSYRTDNGQQDPNISSLFDFTNSDCLLTGQDIPGHLGTDRTNGEIPVCPNATGPQPLSTTLTATSFTCTGGPRGALGRTPWIFPFNAHGEYSMKIKGERMRAKFVADLFNIGNEQAVVRVNQFGEQSGSPGVANARLAVRFEF